MAGSRWKNHRSRHCLPRRPPTLAASSRHATFCAPPARFTCRGRRGEGAGDGSAGEGQRDSDEHEWADKREWSIAGCRAAGIKQGRRQRVALPAPPTHLRSNHLILLRCELAAARAAPQRTHVARHALLRAAREAVASQVGAHARPVCHSRLLHRADQQPVLRLAPVQGAQAAQVLGAAARQNGAEGAETVPGAADSADAQRNPGCHEALRRRPCRRQVARHGRGSPRGVGAACP